MHITTHADHLHAHCNADYIHKDTGEKAYGYDLCEQFDEMLNDAYPEVEYCLILLHSAVISWIGWMRRDGVMLKQND